MTRNFWLGLVPSVIMAAGIVLATLVAGLTAGSATRVLLGPVLLAVAVLGADLVESRLSGVTDRRPWAALVFAASFLLAGLIIAQRDPGLVQTFIPSIGVASWATLLLRPSRRRATCGKP
jgi:hypothetical protein